MWRRIEREKFLDSPIKTLGDNRGSIDLIKNPEHHSRTKHIDVQYHYVREVAEDGLIKAAWGPTKEIIADILTKPTKPTVLPASEGKIGPHQGGSLTRHKTPWPLRHSRIFVRGTTFSLLDEHSHPLILDCRRLSRCHRPHWVHGPTGTHRGGFHCNLIDQ